MKAIFDNLSLDISKKTTNLYSTSFSAGIFLLDRSLHDAIYAIYGFVRFADEIVDSFESYKQAELLEKFNNDTWQAIEEKISLNPILNSFQWAVNTYKIDHQLIKDFLYSMEMDLSKQVYSRELYEKYIWGSAEVVGLMCLHVFLDGDLEKYEKLKPYAISLGSAFQKVNFLRDYHTDLDTLGRTYFPHIDKELDVDSLKAIVKEIEDDFTNALIGIKQLPSSSQLGVYVAYIYYQNLLKKIKSSSLQNIMNNRIRISNPKKVFLAIKAFCNIKLLKKVFAALILLFSITAAEAKYIAAEYTDIRKLYRYSSHNKANAKDFYKLNKEIIRTKKDLNLVDKAYHAASLMVDAKYGINVFRKLKNFGKGKKLLDEVLGQDPDHPELRYIRFAMQLYAPKFLSYSDNIDEDTNFLYNAVVNKVITDPDFKATIIELFALERVVPKHRLKIMEES